MIIVIFIGIMTILPLNLLNAEAVRAHPQRDTRSPVNSDQQEDKTTLNQLVTTHPTGLISSSTENSVWMADHFPDLEDYHFNKIALDRIYSELIILDQNIIPEGDLERETFLNESGYSIDEILPSTVDNSLLPAFPPIGDQGMLGSCAPFATTYYQLTYEQNLVRERNASEGDPTVIFSPKWTYNLINNGQNRGSTFSDAYKVLLNLGSASLDEFPYDSNYRAWPLNRSIWRNALNYKLSGAGWGLIGDENDTVFINKLKIQLTNGHVLAIGVYIDFWVYDTVVDDNSTSLDDAFVGEVCAVYQTTLSGGPNLPGHAMVLVGYNDEIWCDFNENGVVEPEEKGAFKVANSWGSGWGNDGFIWISYDAVRTSSSVPSSPTWPPEDLDLNRIIDEVYFITAVPNSPKIVAEITLYGNNRYQNKIYTGTTYYLNDPITSGGSYLPFKYDGAPMAFDGTSVPCNCTFVLDLTNGYPEEPNGLTYKWIMKIEDNTIDDPTTLQNYILYEVTPSGDIPVGEALNQPIIIDGAQVSYNITYQPGSLDYAPIAKINASSITGFKPLSIVFNGSKSNVVNGDIVWYEWDFRDGYNDTGEVVNHTFNDMGQYPVTLIVTDTRGTKNYDQEEITVYDPYDWSPPNTTATLVGLMDQHGWYSSVELSLSAVDDISGVNETYCSLDGVSWGIYSQPLYIIAEGKYELSYYSIDEIGNQEPVKQTDFTILKMNYSNPVYVLQENYDSEPLGVTPSGWEPNTASIQVSDTYFYGTSGYSTHIVTTGGYVYKSFTPETGIVVASALIKPKSSCFSFRVDDEEYFQYGTHTFPGSPEVFFSRDGLRVNTPGGFVEIGEYTQGVWYNVTLLIDLPQHEYHIFINGGLFKANIPTSIEEVKGVTFGGAQYGGILSDTYLDEFFLAVPLEQPDSTKPQTTIILNGTKIREGYSSNVTVSFTAIDDTHVAATYFKIDGGLWNNYTDPFVVSLEGTTYVEYYSIDDNGNEEKHKITPIIIDRVKKKWIIVFNNGFENETLGQTPNGWYTDYGGTITVVDSTSYNSTGKSAYFYCPSTLRGPGYVVSTFETRKDLFVASLVIKPVSGWIHVRIDDEETLNPSCHTGGSVPDIMFQSGKIFANYIGGWAELQNYVEERWYQVKMVINLDNQIYDVYIDDIPVAALLPIVMDVPKNIVIGSETCLYPSEAYIDEILLEVDPPLRSLYLVVQGNNDGIYHNIWYEDDYWNGWVNLPGVTNNRPAEVVLGTDLHLVVRGKNNGMFHGWLNPETETFSGWTKLSGDTPSPHVLTASSDKLYLVVRGNNDRIYYREWDGSWSVWRSVSGATKEGPAATVVGDNMHLVVIGTNGRLYHGVVDTTDYSFSGWSGISGSTPSQPVLADNESSVYLVVRGSNDKIYVNEYTGTWSGWTGLPGSTGMSPGAVVYEDELHVVVKGITGGLYHGTWDLSSHVFGGWTRLSGDTPSPPTLAAD